MEKIPLTPLYQLPEYYRLILVEDLIDDWPRMDAEDREHVMFHNPELVKAAGLWPGVPGDAAMLKILREDPNGETRPRAPKLQPAKWHELKPNIRQTLVKSLQRAWPNMGVVHRRLEIARYPHEVLEAGLWPGREGASPDWAASPSMLEDPYISWNEMPEEFQRAVVERLRKEWPKTEAGFKQILKTHDPAMLHAAGLWSEEE